MKFKAFTAGVAGLAFGAALGVAGQAAATVYIQVQTAGYNGGVAKEVASDPDTASITNATYGSFTVANLTGTVGFGPGLLASDTIDKRKGTKGVGVLKLWVTLTGVSSPLGNLEWTSGFTENLLPKGWTVLEETLVSTSDAKYAGTVLSSYTFTTNGAQSFVKSFNTGSGPYSVTEYYQITAPTANLSESTISLSAVPEPGAWALMLIGVGGLGLALRRSRVRAVRAI